MTAAGVLAGPNGGIVTAFSRDEGKKVYVSHRIREHGAQVAAMLQRGAVVCVSGRADKMPSDVAAAFRDVLVEHGGVGSVEGAEKVVKQLEAQGKYQVEVWA